MERETGNNQSFTRTIDERGRICVPKQVLEFLGEFFLSAGGNRSLILLPVDLTVKIMQDNAFIQHDLLRREFCKCLIKPQLDSRDRLVLPRHLLYHMRIISGGKVQFILIDNHVELVPVNEE